MSPVVLYREPATSEASPCPDRFLEALLVEPTLGAELVVAGIVLARAVAGHRRIIWLTTRAGQARIADEVRADRGAA